MKYYAKIANDIVLYLGKAKKVPKTCTEISKADYERYLEITRSVEQREGYTAIITLYTDFTYIVEYIPIEEE